MTPQDEFEQQVKLNIKRLSEDPSLKRLSNQWIEAIVPHKYTYNFKWLGRPIIQIPQDMVAVQGYPLGRPNILPAQVQVLARVALLVLRR